jgi:hypothetical protein
MDNKILAGLAIAALITVTTGIIQDATHSWKSPAGWI